jgi:hypothetical protein
LKARYPGQNMPRSLIMKMQMNRSGTARVLKVCQGNTELWVFRQAQASITTNYLEQQANLYKEHADNLYNTKVKSTPTPSTDFTEDKLDKLMTANTVAATAGGAAGNGGLEEGSVMTEAELDRQMREAAALRALDKQRSHLAKLDPSRFFGHDDKVNADVAFCDVVSKMLIDAGPSCTSADLELRSRKSLMVTCRGVGIVITPTVDLKVLNANTQAFLEACLEHIVTVTIGKTGAIVHVNRRCTLYTQAKMWLELCAVLKIRDESLLGLPFTLEAVSLSQVPDMQLAGKVSLHTTNMEFAFSKVLQSEIIVDINNLTDAYQSQGSAVSGSTTGALQEACEHIKKLVPPGNMGPEDEFQKTKDWWAAGGTVAKALKNCTPLKNTYLKLSASSSYDKNVAPRVQTLMNHLRTVGLSGISRAADEMAGLRSKATAQDMLLLDKQLAETAMTLEQSFQETADAVAQNISGEKPLQEVSADIHAGYTKLASVRDRVGTHMTQAARNDLDRSLLKMKTLYESLSTGVDKEVLNDSVMKFSKALAKSPETTMMVQELKDLENMLTKIPLSFRVQLAQADAFADVAEHLMHECSRGIGEEDDDPLWKTRHTRCYNLVVRFLKMMPTDKEFKQLPDVVSMKAMDMGCKIRSAIAGYAEEREKEGSSYFSSNKKAKELLHAALRYQATKKGWKVEGYEAERVQELWNAAESEFDLVLTEADAVLEDHKDNNLAAALLNELLFYLTKWLLASYCLIYFIGPLPSDASF